jgi:hypothetical protein
VKLGPIKCGPCTERKHGRCRGWLRMDGTWCECPCWTGEEADPVSESPIAMTPEGPLLTVLRQERASVSREAGP